MNNSTPSQAIQTIGQIFNVTKWNADSTIAVATANFPRANPCKEAQAELDHHGVKATVVSAVTGDGQIRFHIKY